jgi:hypothetical protein
MNTDDHTRYTAHQIKAALYEVLLGVIIVGASSRGLPVIRLEENIIKEVLDKLEAV